MANPLFNMFNQNPNPTPNLWQQFQSFLNNFRGDPKQKVQDLLNSGQMTQEQFNQFSNIASQITGKRNNQY